MICINNIKKSFSGRQILDDITFGMDSGRITAIIGPSGVGKSTLLRTINALERADEGRITIGDFTLDHAVARSSDVIGLRKRTAMVFQHFNLFRRKTVLENIIEGPVTVQKIAKRDARLKASEQLAKVGLAGYEDYYPQQLSGGQQQRVAIARALAMSPRLLLLDEPTSALDPELVSEVLGAIRQVAAEKNTLLLVSHEMDFVRQIADRVLFLDDGHVIESGTTEDIFVRSTQPRIREFLASYYQPESANVTFERGR